jgi:FAD/FMN-containing dehydrogenase
MQIDNAIHRIKAAVGAKGWSENSTELIPSMMYSVGCPPGEAKLFVSPLTTEEVSQVMALCNQANIPVVPQGGNTGMCGGAIPDPSKTSVILSLRRMNNVRDLSTLDYTITVEAGCILQDIQGAAEQANRFFPLSLGAEGSCQIGGNLATNAGGINVLRYGNTRDLALGLEVVLPDGTVLNGLRRLKKDNTGYDLKHLFIGAEGTMGIITAAVLKLFPYPQSRSTAFCAIVDLESSLSLLAMARELSGDQISSFELIPRIALETVAKHRDDIQLPFSPGEAEWYVLMEISTSRKNDDLGSLNELILGEAIDAGIISNAVIAQSEKQKNGLWAIREALVEVQKEEGYSIKHDVSVPINRIPELIHLACERVLAICPGIRPYPFGHVGDGNIHFNFSPPPTLPAKKFLEFIDQINQIVYDIVDSLDGSFSAEHGIGQTKVAALETYRSATEVALMKNIKQLVDPRYLMNPGKLFPDPAFNSEAI